MGTLSKLSFLQWRNTIYQGVLLQSVYGHLDRGRPPPPSAMPKKNRNVVLLSTRHAEADVSDREDKKPVIVLNYNSNKGGVDNLDKVIGTYSCRRMTTRWPLVIFHNILEVSSYNAFVIWREIHPDWMPGKRNKRRSWERLSWLRSSHDEHGKNMGGQNKCTMYVCGMWCD